MRWNDPVKEDIRAEFAFLLRENDIYMDLVQTLDEELGALISDLDKKQ
jgi:arylsulfatase A-like enzyme